jgi:hypothetical protein
MEHFIFSLLINRDPFEKNVKNNFRPPFENCQEYAPPRNSKGVAYSLQISITMHIRHTKFVFVREVSITPTGSGNYFFAV